MNAKTIESQTSREKGVIVIHVLDLSPGLGVTKVNGTVM